MRVVMHTATAIIGKMRGNDQCHSRNEQPGVIVHKEEFYDQKNDAGTEQDKRPLVMMVFPVTVIEGPGPDTEREEDHSGLKHHVMDDIDAK